MLWWIPNPWYFSGILEARWYPTPIGWYRHQAYSLNYFPAFFHLIPHTTAPNFTQFWLWLKSANWKGCSTAIKVDWVVLVYEIKNTLRCCNENSMHDEEVSFVVTGKNKLYWARVNPVLDLRTMWIPTPRHLNNHLHCHLNLRFSSFFLLINFFLSCGI